jgi:outer membrane protein assembly factor BamB
MSCFGEMTGFRFCDHLAVVPVFVNTGAALLPAIAALLASFIAILLRPRQLVRICREKPYWPLGMLAGALGVWLGIGWLSGGRPGQADGARLAASSPARMMEPEDWVQLARQLAASRAPAAAAASQQSPAEAPSAGGPLGLAGGNARSGYLGGPSPAGLSKLWAYSENSAMFLSTPLVRAGRVYGACCILDLVGSYGTVVCLDADTGKRIWRVELKDASHDFKGFFSSPAMSADGKSLVIGQGLHPDYDSDLVCLDAETGKVKWLIDCPLHIESSPAIEGDMVVAGAGAVEDSATHLPARHSDPAKDKNPGYVFAASISTGKVIWKHVLNDPESSPAVENAVVYIGSGFNGNAVAALHLAETDGQLQAAGKSRQIWKTPTPFPATGAITLTDELVLVGCGNGDYVFQAPDPAGAVMALDKRTGKVRWTLPMPDGVLGPIAVRGQTAIVPVRNGEIVAVNIAAKDDASRILWRTVARQGARILAGCALTETNVYAVTHDGHLVVMDAKTGKVLKSSYVNADPGEMGMSIASPMVGGGRVYVGSETGGLRCYGDGGNGN